MKKLVVLLILLALTADIFAQSTKAVANSISCAADGSSTQVLPATASRESYLISNTSGGTVRIGFVASGTPDLTDSNSIRLLAGQIFTDASPGIFVGRIVCMNDAAGTATVYVVETRRP